ncbi:hypothetical protein C1H46_025590 [Malus baccata]|uniref:Uncharacterized protein n=1 Tax=Malus baccata TaxID=106549 RepID=A0A540LQS7_MALBA|nr:hypothetical protein C1H46_025590 [Malus baccata]
MKFNTLEQGQMFLSKQMNLEDQIALRPERYVAGWEEAKGLKGTLSRLMKGFRKQCNNHPLLSISNTMSYFLASSPILIIG